MNKLQFVQTILYIYSNLMLEKRNYLKNSIYKKKTEKKTQITKKEFGMF